LWHSDTGAFGRSLPARYRRVVFTGFGMNFVILFANVPVLNILQSYLYLGALGVLALLLTDQAQHKPGSVGG